MKIQPKHFLAITIVSALAAGAFFLGKSLSFVWNKEHKLQTSSDVIGLQTAINNFYSEYGSLPKLGVASGTTDGAIGETLLIILLGKEASGPTMQNPKQITFLNAKVNKDRAKGGLVYSNAGSGATPEGLCDAWGNPFYVKFDDNHDQEITDPLEVGNIIRNKQVVVYSYGQDQKPGGGDDIKTW
jgi:hypothetical protein